MNNNYRIKLLLEGYFINNLNVFNMQKKPCLFIIIIGRLWWIHIIKLLITKPVSGSNFKISNSFKLQSSSLEHSDVAKRSIYVTVTRLRRRRGNDNGKRPISNFICYFSQHYKSNIPVLQKGDLYMLSFFVQSR